MKRDDWNRRFAAPGYLFGTEPNRFLVADVAGLPPGRALDLACGDGRNAVWLAERGWRVTGVDFSDVALEKAARLAGERRMEVEWVEADLLAYEPKPRAFDLVVILYLQLPAEELGSVLERAARAVAPGGTLLVVGHHRDNLEHGHGGPQEPSVLYTPADLVTHLDGLRVERAERVERSVETEAGEAVALDALVRARR